MRLLIGIPTYDNAVNASLMTAILNETRSPHTPPFVVANQAMSLLAHGCNRLWCAALNGRKDFTHFLMLHSDVIPQEEGWLANLARTMETAQADILSAAIPIKDERGLLSTALLHHSDGGGLGSGTQARRRITMHELAQLPETFDARDVAKVFEWKDAQPCLLANTGLMLVDLRGGWVEQCYFTIQDVLWRGEDGIFYCDVDPEDWFFTRRAQQHGARVCVTKSIRLKHAGRAQFPNYGAWGKEHDE